MSRTCWRCCALPRTRATASPVSASCICCRASGPRPRSACSTRWPRAPTRCARSASFRCRRAPARTGPPSSAPVGELCATRNGRPISSACGCWYEPHLERIHEDAETRRADLMQLEQIASGYPSREHFLTELTLDPPDATSDESGPPLRDEDYLILSTIHSAKGQEWKSVFVLNVVDGCMPSDLGAGTTRRARGGAPPALRRDDARQGRSAPGRAAALLRPRPASQGRPPRLRLAHPLHPGAAGLSVRARRLAEGRRGRGAHRAQGPKVDIGARMRGMWR